MHKTSDIRTTLFSSIDATIITTIISALFDANESVQCPDETTIMSTIGTTVNDTNCSNFSTDEVPKQPAPRPANSSKYARGGILKTSYSNVTSATSKNVFDFYLAVNPCLRVVY